MVTDTVRDKKHDVSISGGPKADSGGKGAGEHGAVWASWDSHLDPCRWMPRGLEKHGVSPTQTPFSKPSASSSSPEMKEEGLGEFGLMDGMKMQSLSQDAHSYREIT